MSRQKNDSRHCLRRAGLKLEAALDAFAVDVRDVVALDSGLSTGGFTDCLLQRGAARVYGVDVGFGQVTCGAVTGANTRPSSHVLTCSCLQASDDGQWSCNISLHRAAYDRGWDIPIVLHRS